VSKPDLGQANLFEDTATAARVSRTSANPFVLPAIRIMQSRAPGVVIEAGEIIDILRSHGVSEAVAVDAVNEAGLECAADGSLIDETVAHGGFWTFRRGPV
jgi:hypothetical protein